MSIGNFESQFPISGSPLKPGGLMYRDERPVDLGDTIEGIPLPVDPHTGDRVGSAQWVPRSESLDIPQYVWDRLPDPCGWMLLVREYRRGAKSSGGIIFSGETQDHIASMNYIGRVLAVGPAAYKHPKFSVLGNDGVSRLSDPWVRPGQWAAFKRFTSVPLKIDHDGVTWCFRMIPDDTIDAIISRPDAITIYLPTRHA